MRHKIFWDPGNPLLVMMAAFSFLLISLLSLPLIDTTDDSGTSLSAPTIILDEEEKNISETLPVSIFSSEPQQPLPDLCVQVLVKREGIQPTWPEQDQPGLQFLPTNGHRTRELHVTFDYSGAALFNSSVGVIVSIFFPEDNGCTTKPDQDNLLGKGTAVLYDDRVSVEWLSHSADCYVNQSCSSFSAKIGRVSHSLKGSLHLTANITQTSQESPTIIFPVKSETDDLVNFTHTFCEVGAFTAVLSVPYVLRRNVYWKRQRLDINVKIYNIQNEVEDLKLQVSNLQELLCLPQECGKYSRCIDGRCECTLPWVYSGSKCTDFVGCDNSPEACGSRRYGHCHKPTNPFVRLYSCRCFDDNVSGDNCENCRNENFCGNHGTCAVNESGIATCNCHKDFTGQNCQNCTRDCVHGHCVIKNDLPTCECDDNFRLDSTHSCAECMNGWTGDACNEPDCEANNAICNGGVCNEGGKDCDCTQTNYTGPLCQLKKCNASDVNYCKDSGGTCVYNPGSGAKVCYCDDGRVVASNETCNSTATPSPTPPSTPPPTPSPTPPADPCSSEPCKHGECSPNEDGDGHTCKCPPGFTGENCDEGEETESETTPGIVLNQTDNNSQLLYGGLAVFIAVLVVSVVAYIAYHNREKILELFGGKKESVVEMAMRSRIKKKGYKKLPTSIHDTLTHED